MHNLSLLNRPSDINCGVDGMQRRAKVGRRRGRRPIEMEPEGLSMIPKRIMNSRL